MYTCTQIINERLTDIRRYNSNPINIFNIIHVFNYAFDYVMFYWVTI